MCPRFFQVLSLLAPLPGRALSLYKVLFASIWRCLLFYLLAPVFSLASTFFALIPISLTSLVLFRCLPICLRVFSTPDPQACQCLCPLNGHCFYKSVSCSLPVSLVSLWCSCMSVSPLPSQHSQVPGPPATCPLKAWTLAEVQRPGGSSRLQPASPNPAGLQWVGYCASIPEDQAELEKAPDTQVLGCRAATWPMSLPKAGGGLRAGGPREATSLEQLFCVVLEAADKLISSSPSPTDRQKGPK